jgi:U6 snRNA-associated Sm-like protein LSm8
LSRIEKVCVITVEGRCIAGKLIACDSVTNLIIENAIERVIRPAKDPDGSFEQPLGVFMVRGDTVVLCGLLDEELDNSINWNEVHGSKIGTTKHV